MTARTHSARLIPVAPAAALFLLSEAWLVARASRGPTVWALSASFLVDLVLIAGAVALLVQGAGERGRRWGARVFLLGVPVLGGIGRHLGVGALPAARWAGPVTELVLMAWVARSFARGGAASPWARSRETLARVFPAPIASAVVTEAQMLWGAADALLRRPLPAFPPRAFGFLRTSQSGFLVPTFLLLSAVELAAVHAAVASFWPGHWLAHGAILLVHVYGALWLVGDRRWLQRTCHRIEGDTLVLELGLRCRARIPLATVTRALPLRSMQERRSVQPRTGKNAQVTPYDAPNVHLCLSAPIELERLLGWRTAATHLDLYVDEPEAFIRAVV